MTIEGSRGRVRLHEIGPDYAQHCRSGNDTIAWGKGGLFEQFMTINQRGRSAPFYERRE